MEGLWQIVSNVEINSEVGEEPISANLKPSCWSVLQLPKKPFLDNFRFADDSESPRRVQLLDPRDPVGILSDPYPSGNCRGYRF